MTGADARCAIEVYKALYPRLYRVARAIEVFEGNIGNNPGNLRWSPFGKGTLNGFAHFDNYNVGFLALLFDLRAKAQGKTRTALTPDSTIEELMKVYAPPNENDTRSYLRFVEERTSLPASTRLGELL